jgi:hypothetical protein
MRLAFVLLLGGCPAPTGGGDDVTGDDDDTTRDCTDFVDSDGDLVADLDEGVGDVDADGQPNVGDTDDDGDNVPTAVEAGDTDICTPPRNSDTDDFADFLDTDSDNDSLSDGQENQLGTDPGNPDSDGDGFPDGAEVSYGTDPLDPTSTIDADDFYVILPFNAPEHVLRNLVFGTDIEVADVYFLVDTTGSMDLTIAGVQGGLVDTIIPGIRAAIGNSQMGVGEFEDFAYGAYGYANCSDFRGLPEDRGKDHAFNALQSITDSDEDVYDAVDLLDSPMGCGADGSEAYVEALYQAAVGDGIVKTGGGEPYAPAVECPDILDEPGDRIGGACFRPGALPVILLFGDNDFHNGPPDGRYDPYSIPDADPDPHDWNEAVDALNGIGARVIGLTAATTDFCGGVFGDLPGAGCESLNHMCDTAEATGTVRRDGTPLCFTYDASGAGLDDQIVDAIEELASDVPQDVSTSTEDAAGDLVDATQFIKDITTVSADPESGISGMDEHVFFDVEPGTRVEFQVDFYNDFQPEQEEPQLYPCTIVVLGNGVARLDERRVLVEIPSITGEVIF